MVMGNGKPGQMDGVLILNKPQGPTSAACLNAIKRELGQKKIGHAGTLDPLARGLLLVLLGQATKLASYLVSGEKVYCGELLLGVTTDTYDVDGAITATIDPSSITEEQVRAEVEHWKTLTEQVVPGYSAAKHEGKPLYALSRAGLDVPIKTKEIRIPLAEILEINLPRVTFRVRCSHGTYIRSLAHSLGKRLRCGAVLAKLLREQSHPFSLEQAFSLEEVLQDPPGLAKRVIPLTESLPHWPKIRLSASDTDKVKTGLRIPVGGNEREDCFAMLLDPLGNPLALVQAKGEGRTLQWTILRGLWSA